MCACEAGNGVTAVVQKTLKERQIVLAECNSGGESGKRRDPGVGVGPPLQQQGDASDGALPDRHQQRTDGVKAQAGAGVQQHLCCLRAAVGHSEVERCGAPIGVLQGAAAGQPGVHVRTCLQQHGCCGVSVALCCQVEGADAAVAEPGSTRHRDEQGHNPEG